MDDVTRAMSKGGGVLVNVQEWVCFSIFGRADDVTLTMSKDGSDGNRFQFPKSIIGNKSNSILELESVSWCADCGI